MSFWLIYKSDFFSLKNQNYVALTGWIISIFGGIAIWYIYNKVYQIERINADTFKFFDDAIIIGSYFNSYPAEVLKIFFGVYDISDSNTIEILEKTTHWFRPYHFGEFNDNQIVIRLNLLILLISNGFYFTHLLLFNFLGFLGVWLLIKTLSCKVELKNSFLWVMIFLIPNAWLWNSGVLKEPILIFFLGLLLFGIWHNFKAKKWKFLIWALSILGLLMVKAYVILCLLPSLILLLLFKNKNFWRQTVVLYSAAIVLIVSMYYLFGINPSQIIAQKQIDFNNVAKISDANSYFETFTLEPNPISILKNSPMAFINSIFRPYFWNSSSFFMVISSLENLLLFVFLVFILFWKKRETPFLNQYKNFVLLFAMNLYVLVGLTTTVSGAMVRYKIPATILLSIFILIYLFKKDNLINEKVPS